MMNSPTTVLLVTRQEETAAAVTEALHGHEHFVLANRCEDLDDLREYLTHAHAAAVLVDIDPEPGSLLEQIEPLVAHFVETRFVLLANEVGPDLLLEAMQAGARHLLLKSAIKATLTAVLNRLLPANENGSTGDGAIITLLSGSGGCGTTTLAFNMANELASPPPREALLIDLDWNYGAIAPYLGLHGQYGIGDLLARNDHIDGDLVRSTAVAYSDHLHVLLSPVSGNALYSRPLHHRKLHNVLNACKHAYAYTIIDAPRVSPQVAATLANVSTVVLMVFQLTVKDIHTVRAMRAALLKLGIPQSQIVLVANRYDKHCSVPLNEAQDALGGQQVCLIANNYRPAADGIKRGRPLTETGPSSLLRRDIKQLIDSLEWSSKLQWQMPMTHEHPVDSYIRG